MLWIFAMDQQACLFKLYPACVHVSSICMTTVPSHHCHRIIRHIYHYACFILVACMSETKKVFFRKQLHETSRPVVAPTSLNFVLKQQAGLIQLHPTAWNVSYNCTLPACIFVRAPSHQQICLNQLQLTYSTSVVVGG